MESTIKTKFQINYFGLISPFSIILLVSRENFSKIAIEQNLEGLIPASSNKTAPKSHQCKTQSAMHTKKIKRTRIYIDTSSDLCLCFFFFFLWCPCSSVVELPSVFDFFSLFTFNTSFGSGFSLFSSVRVVT